MPQTGRARHRRRHVSRWRSATLVPGLLLAGACSAPSVPASGTPSSVASASPPGVAGASSTVAQPPGAAPGSTASDHPADCVGKDLTVQVDPTRTGPLAGAENVVLLVQNTGTAPCWLAGTPTLWGLNTSGEQTQLPFAASLDPAAANPAPATGPGVLPPSGHGALHLTMQLNNCPTASRDYVQLKIGLHLGDSLLMPYPAQLKLSGCFGNEAAIGPVNS